MGVSDSYAYLFEGWGKFIFSLFGSWTAGGVWTRGLNGLLT